MAEGARAGSGADLAVAVTGIAGRAAGRRPSRSGLTYVAAADADGCGRSPLRLVAATGSRNKRRQRGGGARAAARARVDAARRDPPSDPRGGGDRARPRAVRDRPPIRPGRTDPRRRGGAAPARAAAALLGRAAGADRRSGCDPGAVAALARRRSTRPGSRHAGATIPPTSPRVPRPDRLAVTQGPDRGRSGPPGAARAARELGIPARALAAGRRRRGASGGRSSGSPGRTARAPPPAGSSTSSSRRARIRRPSSGRCCRQRSTGGAAGDRPAGGAAIGVRRRGRRVRRQLRPVPAGVVVVLTSVEWDHPDVFADRAAVIDAFEALDRAATSPGPARRSAANARRRRRGLGRRERARLGLARLAGHGRRDGRSSAGPPPRAGVARAASPSSSRRPPVPRRPLLGRITGCDPNGDDARDQRPRPARRAGHGRARDRRPPQRGQCPRRGRGRLALGLEPGAIRARLASFAGRRPAPRAQGRGRAGSSSTTTTATTRRRSVETLARRPPARAGPAGSGRSTSR